MSLYEVQKLLFHVNREPKPFDRFLRERETLVAEYRLTPEEQRAVLETDFQRLYETGVHSLLLGPLAATEIRTWIAVAAAAGDAQGVLLAYQPVPAWSTGCAVAVLEIEDAKLR